MLLVKDDATIRILLEKTLARLAFETVHSALDGSDPLKTVEGAAG